MSARVNQLTEQFDYFGHAIQSGQSPEPDGEHGLVDMEIIQSIYERNQ